jgi:FtsP/CotA-like multicopper oxidase with cupredoxin domain
VTRRYYIAAEEVVWDFAPTGVAVADMTANNPGTWMMHCHVADHIAMQGC